MTRIIKYYENQLKEVNILLEINENERKELIKKHQELVKLIINKREKEENNYIVSADLVSNEDK